MSDRYNGSLQADYIVIGAGSAGAVVANRLSENPAVRVILIEAGGEAKGFMVQLPAGIMRLLGNPAFDWGYEQVPDPTINGRKFLWSGGRLLGGSSSINGQVYIRGTRRDFDRWAQAGAIGWAFDDVMPYFLRSEQWHGAPNAAHGLNGPQSVSPMRDPHPLCRDFLKGCNEIGLSTLVEYNGGDMEGVYLTVASQRNGWRCSTEKAYLRPARRRPNLQVMTFSEVEQIRFKDRRATGVSLLRQGKNLYIEATREVIVSAGAMGTPALLMRSGVGPGDHLKASGVAVVHDLPGVGKNLYDQPAVSLNKRVNKPTINSQLRWYHMIAHAARFALNRRGPLSAPAVQAMALARTRDGLIEPDIQLHFLPMAFHVDSDTEVFGAHGLPREPGISINATVCQPASRGRVELGERGRPRIVHEMFGDQRDLHTLVAGCQLIERLFKSQSLAALTIGDGTPNPVPTTPEGWTDFVRSKAAVANHPVGSCRMGTDPEAVVDPQLRVRGLAGLRVIDASVMPSITSSNTNAATIMIGEKGADLIQQDTNG